MRYRPLQGHERDYLIQRAGSCTCCGFSEIDLIAWSDGGEDEGVLCVECYAPLLVGDDAQLEAIYLPETPLPVFAHYLRVLGWACYSALTCTLRDHDLSTGSLPEPFLSGTGWKADLRWKSLAEGLEDQSADPIDIGALRRVLDACRFLVARRDYTVATYGSAEASSLRTSLGDDAFKRDFRVMKPGLEAARIRNWGQHPGTFRLLCNRGQLLGKRDK